MTIRGEALSDLAKYAAAHWNPAMQKDAVGLGIDRYKFDNFLKEVYLDSDTRVGLLSGAPFDDPDNWFLSNDQIKQAADTVNRIAGRQRLLYHSLFTPKQPGWLDEVDRCIATVRPTSWKGYTIGDPLSPQTTKYPWRLDDDEADGSVLRQDRQGGHHHGVHPQGPAAEGLRDLDPGRGVALRQRRRCAARRRRQWPQIDFVIYHSALRAFLEDPQSELDRVREDRQDRVGQRPRRRFRRSSASATSIATSAPRSPFRRSPIRGSAPP